MFQDAETPGRHGICGCIKRRLVPLSCSQPPSKMYTPPRPLAHPTPPRSQVLPLVVRCPANNFAFLSIFIRPRRLPNGDSTGASSIPRTAIHDACLILTGTHKSPGCLYRDRECQQEAAEDHLSAGTFFYMLSTADTTYPIFQTFDRWVPPDRADIPDNWFPSGWPRNPPADERPAWRDVVDARVLNSRTALSKIAKELDCAGDTGGCAVSGYQQPLKGSHIIPVAKSAWVQCPSPRGSAAN